MGKKHDKKPKLSKKELRKIAEREAVKAAEKKARKKAERKVRNTEAETVTVAAEKPAKGKKERHPHLEHLDRVGELIAITKDKGAKKSARKEAQAELDRLRAEGEARIAAADAAKAAEVSPEQTAAEIDEQIKARLAAKRAGADSKERLSALQAKVATDRASRIEAAQTDQAVHGDASGAPTLVEVDGKKVAEVTHTDLEAASQIDERDPAAGHEFAAPAEAPSRFEDNVNGLGQYKVVDPDGKERGYTRVTTYIDALEDKTRLTEWKMRLLLEGVAVAETPDEEGKAEPVTARVRDLIHRRDVAIAKARKADRKGKLVPGQLAPLIDAAYSEFKREMNKLVDDLFELGGGREAATKGTDLHALCDLYDRDGIAAVNEKLEAGEITPSDFADVEAYARKMKALGAEVVASEMVIVHDDLRVAGRLDRVVKVRLPEIRNSKGEVIYAGDTRARRYVADIKTGRVDYSAGKIAQQIRMYAEGKAYDAETHERTSHGANRTHGLLIHVPAGTGTATIHLVDLGIGGDGNKLAGQVRAFRNTGKRAFDTKVDVVAQIPSEDAA